jgi:hypothetical protein
LAVGALNLESRNGLSMKQLRTDSTAGTGRYSHERVCLNRFCYVCQRLGCSAYYWDSQPITGAAQWRYSTLVTPQFRAQMAGPPLLAFLTREVRAIELVILAI